MFAGWEPHSACSVSHAFCLISFHLDMVRLLCPLKNREHCCPHIEWLSHPVEWDGIQGLCHTPSTTRAFEPRCSPSSLSLSLRAYGGDQTPSFCSQWRMATQQRVSGNNVIAATHVELIQVLFCLWTDCVNTHTHTHTALMSLTSHIHHSRPTHTTEVILLSLHLCLGLLHAVQSPSL